ncbi:MAG: heme-binding protein [Verrucomicrobiales bacterium]|nr:heme-binding protein [Verrucomicrobiales bacterium]
MKRTTSILLAAAIAAVPFTAEAAAKKKKRPRRPQTVGPAINENKATPISRIKAAPGFKVELVYSVPGVQQGSWVNLGLDNKNRIIACDQFGGLYRFPAPAPGKKIDPKSVKKIPVDIRAVNGILWAFDALYVAVNDYERKIDSGLYRITDSDGDDELDKVEKLRPMFARGDHGVHALLLSPDKKSIYMITGNNTEPAEAQKSRVPRVWGEDHLIARMPDGRGHNRDRLAPAGIIYKISPDGKQWEIISSGYRNIFDGGFNKDGELFTYDADMEYDFNTPWYRPTRVNHVTSGSMYGWRNGTGKRPEFYPDNLPASINIGPGSPTGVTFGYGAKFPAKYQNALYILDWSWGKVYAVHLEPEGSSYTATKEEFLIGSPLPVTDAIIHPKDGAMYVSIGGRRVQSGLYRVTYTGKESTKPAPYKYNKSKLVSLRKKLETFHQKNPKAIGQAWPNLAHSDRFVRWAARIAVMHQPLKQWTNKALKEKDHAKRVEALLGLAKMGGIDPFHREDTDSPVNNGLARQIVNSLLEVDYAKLPTAQKHTMVRAYQIAFNRFGRPSRGTVEKIVHQLNPHFPAPTFEENWLLCETLAYLSAPDTAYKTMKLIAAAPTQEEQMEYARSIRFLKQGWTPKLRRQYFEWFLKAANYRGGASFSKFIEFIRRDAVASLSRSEQTKLKDILDKKPVRKSPLEMLAEAMVGRSYVKEWKLDEISKIAAVGLKNRSYERGRKMFAAAGCFACHRFANEGGMTGPDLTGSGGRYNTHDLLDQIINPSKEINEQFVPIEIITLDGKKTTGIVVNLNGDGVTVNTDMFDPNQRVTLDRKKVKSIEPSKVSPMPAGLLNMLQKEEILDLLAYILSGGNAENEMFTK